MPASQSLDSFHLSTRSISETPHTGDNNTLHSWDGNSTELGASFNLTCQDGFAFEHLWVYELINTCAVADGGGIFWVYNDTRLVIKIFYSVNSAVYKDVGPRN